MRLRTHLVVLVIAVLVPAVALTALAVFRVVKHEREAGERATRETARSIAVRIDRELARAIAALQVLAVSPHLDRDDRDAFRDAARAAVTIDGAWIYLSDVGGQQLMNQIAAPGAPLPRRVTAAMETHRRVVESREPAVSDYVVGALARRPIINVDVPVIRRGQVVYVLSMAIPGEVLHRVLLEADAPLDWIIAIADRRGITIARSHSPEQFIGQPIKDDIRARMVAEAEGIFANITRDGVPVHNAFTRSAIAEWGVVVGVPTTTVTAPLRQALLVIGLSAIAAATVGVLAAGGLGGRIVHAVTDMVRAARALGEGHPVPAPTHTRVTEINELAEALDQAAVLVREREEAQQQLERALKEGDRVKDEFLAALSHELRTPMTAILGWSRMIQSGQLNDVTLHRGIAAIARNAELQARLIEDVLDVSRIITGNITLALEPCSPAAIVREVVESFQPAANDKRLSVQATMTGAVESLLADPGRLRQIMSNLVANAVKFTPEGGRIDVSLEEAGGRLHVAVRDSGVGIEPAFLPHAFDRFRQADGTTTRQYGGLGLGLAIVRDLVKLHGGEVTAESAGVGRGTTVHVWLPITRPTAPAPAPSPEPTSVDGHLRGLRALVVEDEADASDFLSALLQRHGMQVRAVASVQDALAVLAGEAFDVVLSDIGLPGRDGYALVESLRADGKRMPAIAITAFARTQDRDRAAAAGFDRHIAKPFSPHEVIRAVAEVALGRAAGERS